jgi:hypothetical protein
MLLRGAERCADKMSPARTRDGSSHHQGLFGNLTLEANPAKCRIVRSPGGYSSVLNYCMALERGGLCIGGRIYPDPIGTPPFAAADVPRASRPLSRERPAPASRGQDAHATAGGTPTLRESGYPVTRLPVDREG